MPVHRSDPLIRERKFLSAEVAAVASDGRFAGYASLFGRTDLARDMVMPGAFAASLLKRGASGIKLLFQHDPAEPIGVWEDIREDATGLFVRGRLTGEVARAREVAALIRAGAVDGLSIGFRTVRGRTDRATGVRQLLEVDPWEVSVVTFPMLPEARVHTVKRAAPVRGARLPTVREFERLLVRDAGLTRSEAGVVIRSGFNVLVARRDAAIAPERRLAEQIRRAALLLHPER